MNAETINAIHRVLKRYPKGATATLVAARLGWKTTAASQRLGKLYTYGMADRHLAPSTGFTKPPFIYQFKAKDAAHV